MPPPTGCRRSNPNPTARLSGSAIRNLGWPGVSAPAISALDVALWDSEPGCWECAWPISSAARGYAVPLHGSGGLTSHPEHELCRQLAEWVADGITRVKMKVGREPGADPTRVRAAHEAIGADDVIQADVTRACGITGLQTVGALCTACEVPFSADCAPQIHAHVGRAIGPLRHGEYFHTHARAERMLFDGVLAPVNGALIPDPARPGLGIELTGADAERYRV